MLCAVKTTLCKRAFLLRVVRTCHAKLGVYVLCVVVYKLQKKCCACEIQDAKTAM